MTHTVPRSVLLVRLDHPGDYVLSVPPVVAAIRATAPSTRIEVLTVRSSAQLARQDPRIDRVISYDAPWSVPSPGRRSSTRMAYPLRLGAFVFRRLGGDLRAYDAVLHLSFSPVERYLTWGASRCRLGFEGPYETPAHERSARLLTQTVAFDTRRHLTDNSLRLARSVFPDAPDPETRSLFLSPAVRKLGRDCVRGFRRRGHPLVAVQPGGRRSLKCWTDVGFASLLRGMRESMGATCLVVTAPEETDYARWLLAASGSRRVHHVVTRDLLAFAGLVSNVDLFVGNDGAPTHIAAALGRPTVGIYGPTDERVYGPRGPRVYVVRRSTEGAPCSYPWARTQPCCADRSCLRELEPEVVLDAVRIQLEWKEDPRVARPR